jgi:flagellar M-ring protein FliF
VNGFLQTMGRLGPARLAALAAVAAAMLGFFLYIGNRVAAPTYAILYSEIELKDSGQIVQKLEAMGVPYQLRGSGEAVLVPQDQVARLRMMMAEAGLPRGGSAGYAELFDKGEPLGTSSFVQNVNHTRALEG